jgi:fermentation-respiration switch protein FrsA (DUF1100 family)
VTAYRLAAELDAQQASLAYAVEAMLRCLPAQHPEVSDRPVVIAGLSLGGLCAPTTAARVHDAVDAVVIVGGGANVARIIVNGSLTGLATRAPRRLRKPLDELCSAYLNVSRLDPFYTAMALRDIPVLVLHARWDAIVPAATGDLLWERLGRPERWSYPLGHLGLFWWLPNEAKEIADWIDGAVDRGGADRQHGDDGVDVSGRQSTATTGSS